jgi:hypothetical protein
MAAIQSCTSLQKKETSVNRRKKFSYEKKALEVSHISWRGKIVSTGNKLAAQNRVLLEKI